VHPGDFKLGLLLPLPHALFSCLYTQNDGMMDYSY
jgi:hypothetical protein